MEQRTRRYAFGVTMTTILTRPEHKGFGPLRHKLKSLNVGDAEIDAVLNRVKGVTGSKRSGEITSTGRSTKHLTVLLEGVACSYERLPDGSRQIYGFQYAGDFCDLNRHVLRDSNNEVAVEAITDCSTGVIEQSDLDELITLYPSLAVALWRAAMLEASIFRKRLLNIGRQPALERIAHLVCEQLARREAAGIKSATIPMSQMDLADAAGLSVVHISRTFKELQRLGLLGKEGRTIKVLDRSGLACLAGFDGNYLNMPQLLSNWQVEIKSPSPKSKTVPLPSLRSPIEKRQAHARSCAASLKMAARPSDHDRCSLARAGALTVTSAQELPLSRLSSFAGRRP